MAGSARSNDPALGPIGARPFVLFLLALILTPDHDHAEDRDGATDDLLDEGPAAGRGRFLLVGHGSSPKMRLSDRLPRARRNHKNKQDINDIMSCLKRLVEHPTIGRQNAPAFKLMGLKMDAYDPLIPPPIDGWTELDESERIDLVLAYHQKQHDELPNPNAHAVVHVIVENQVALADETPVAAVMERLMQEGLDRHDAIHAIGYVLMGTLHGATEDDSEADPTSAYYRELTQLTAEKWLSQEL